MNANQISVLARVVAAVVILIVPGFVSGEMTPIVIGQSLPLRGAVYSSAARVLQATQTYAAHVNNSGGIQGRKLEVVTLDDDNDPVKLEANIRTLVETHKAVAIMNCLGDTLCERASLLTKELKVPLFGPLSGSRALREPDRPFTIPLRPRYDVQAEALLRQLRAVGISRLVLLTSYPRTAELRATLVETFTRGGIPPSVIEIDESQSHSFDEAAARLRNAEAHAVVLDVSHSTLRKLGAMESDRKFVWPSMLATISPGTLTQLTKEIRSRVIGFISVVPNPEDLRLPVIRELNSQAEQYTGPDAVTFEGAEAYINLRVAVDVARRAGSAVTSDSMMRAVENLKQVDVGGFMVRLNLGTGGPTWVDVGLRSRDGGFLR